VPYAVTYMAHRLVDDLSEVWAHVHSKYHYFLTAGWVNTLLTDTILVWMDEWALRRMASLDLSLMAAGPGGQTMLATYRFMLKAIDVFHWALVVRDVVRRDAQSRQARQVRIQLDDSATYGFVLSHPCRGFDWRPAPGSGLTPSGLPMLDIGVGGLGRGGQGDQGDQGGQRGQGAGHTGLGPNRQDSWARAVATRGGAPARVADQEAPATERVWTSDAAYNSAVALSSSGPVEQMVDDRVPRGTTAAALACAWKTQMEALRGTVRYADVLTLDEAMPLIAGTIGQATDSGVAFDEFHPAVDRLRPLEVAAVSPARFNAGAILGRRASRDDVFDDEEDTRGRRRRSSSVEGGA